MSQEAILGFLDQYGLLFVFGIVFLEYMNFPCLPIAIIFPAIGIWTDYSGTSFLLVNIICLVAGLSGGAVTYFIGYTGGNALIEWGCRKFKAFEAFYRKYKPKLEKNGNWIIFVARITPTVRTLIGYLAGSMRINFGGFMLFSAFGTAINNFVYMAAGLGIWKIIF